MISLKFLKHIICKDSIELKLFLYDFLCKKYGESNVHFKDGYLYCVGKDLFTLSAHMDTVYNKQCTLDSIKTFKVEDQSFITSPLGIGGDDRCGVGIICELINSGLRPTVVFTEDEEIGCVGARKSIKDKKIVQAISNTNFIVEFDRQGNNDAVFYGCKNQEFKKFIFRYGWEEKQGSYSDISVYGPICNKAAVNLSSAYYNPHTLKERINLNEYKDIIKRVRKMLLSKEAKKTSFNYSTNILRK